MEWWLWRLTVNFLRFWRLTVKFWSFCPRVLVNVNCFVFRFLTYLLSCILFLFALRYFVNYAPLFVISPLFFTSLRVYECNSISGSRFFSPRWPWPPTLSSSAFGKQLRFHRFSLISFCSRLKVVFLYCNYYFFALCRNLLLWFVNSKNICWSWTCCVLELALARSLTSL